MTGKGKIAIGIIAFIIMIFGIVGIVNSFNTLNSNIKEVDNKKTVCDNWKTELNQKEKQIESMTLDLDAMQAMNEYNAELLNYQKGCL